MPLHVASITRLTAAISLAEVAALGATANGPDAGRTSGLKSVRFSSNAPCNPTLAWAKEVRPLPLACGRVCGKGAACRMGTAVCLATGTAGRGRGNGISFVAGNAASAQSAQAAITVKNNPERLRPVAFIKPRTCLSIPRLSGETPDQPIH